MGEGAVVNRWTREQLLKINPGLEFGEIVCTPVRACGWCFGRGTEILLDEPGAPEVVCRCCGGARVQ